MRQLAKALDVSQPFLSQIKAGKRPMPEWVKEASRKLGAYHLLITLPNDKQIVTARSAKNGEKQIRNEGVVGGTGFEPVTSAMSTQRSRPLS